MGVLFSRGLGDTLNELVPTRNGRSPRAPQMAAGSELRNSAVWAALRLRSNLISSLPVDAFRKAGGVQTEMPSTPLMLTTPGSLFVGGSAARIDEWLYATQMDLDRYGNAFGIIVARDALMRPTRIDLVSADSVTVRVRDGVVKYRINGKDFDADEVWHERQYVVSGLPVGLSPVAYASLALGQYATAQEFAVQWFNNGGIPSAKMKNTAKTLTPAQASETKQRVKSTIAAGDVLVLGSDWDYQMISVPPAQTQFLDAMNATQSDVARYFDVPGDLIDVAVSGQSVTYANLTQRNLQLLIMHVGPAVQRREKALSGWLPSPQFVKLNTDALLRMDPLQAAQVLGLKVDKRVTTPTEWRALDDRPPLTPEQEAEFARLFNAKAEQPAQITKETA